MLVVTIKSSANSGFLNASRVLAHFLRERKIATCDLHRTRTRRETNGERKILLSRGTRSIFYISFLLKVFQYAPKQKLNKTRSVISDIYSYISREYVRECVYNAHTCLMRVYRQKPINGARLGLLIAKYSFPRPKDNELMRARRNLYFFNVT
ncbi:hypothetical protein PUN28_004796 [Cardiocondyla obscurior]|uniref:Uncharacterized protein n=1 Tax=Cardiocondyla obscurior TaxID=286306 RepID=A0AAW2GFP3_9HYME